MPSNISFYIYIYICNRACENHEPVYCVLVPVTFVINSYPNVHYNKYKSPKIKYQFNLPGSVWNTWSLSSFAKDTKDACSQNRWSGKKADNCWVFALAGGGWVLHPNMSAGLFRSAHGEALQQRHGQHSRPGRSEHFSSFCPLGSDS